MPDSGDHNISGANETPTCDLSGDMHTGKIDQESEDGGSPQNRFYWKLKLPIDL